MKFKIGDIVTCINNDKKSLTLGKKYKVLRTFLDFIIIKNDDNHEADYYSWRFKDVKLERFEKLKRLKSYEI